MPKILRRVPANGFTLIELVVVVVIIGMIAAFAIPNYAKSIEKTYRKNGENNLRILLTAEYAYKAANGVYYISSNLNNLNTNLGLKLLPSDGFDYDCSGGPAVLTGCSAARQPTGQQPYILAIDDAPFSATNPRCTPYVGTCPP